MSAAPNVMECKQPPKVVRLVVSTARCEAKGDCEEVCPYDVFTVRKLNDAERKALPFVTRLKVMAHGGKQAFVTNPENCHSCGLCVAACPEKAIRLVHYDAETAP
jgi:4Fe-4S ferredoxin